MLKHVFKVPLHWRERLIIWSHKRDAAKLLPHAFELRLYLKEHYGDWWPFNQPQSIWKGSRIFKPSKKCTSWIICHAKDQNDKIEFFAATEAPIKAAKWWIFSHHRTQIITIWHYGRPLWSSNAGGGDAAISDQSPQHLLLHHHTGLIGQKAQQNALEIIWIWELQLMWNLSKPWRVFHKALWLLLCCQVVKYECYIIVIVFFELGWPPWLTMTLSTTSVK